MAAADRVAWAERTRRVLRYIAKHRPADIEQLSEALNSQDMAAIRELRDAGFIMRCTETNLWFVPRHALKQQ